MPTVRFDVNDARLRDTLLRVVLPSALAAASGDARPRWGKMTAQQMVEHLEWAFAVSTGRVEAACLVPETQRERIRGFLSDGRPTPRSS